MTTCAEDLPVELWFGIFSYLDVRYLYYSFLGLNNHFNTLLASKKLRLNMQLESNDRFALNIENFHWTNSILSRISCIESYKDYRSVGLFDFLQRYGAKLFELKSLITQVLLQDSSTIHILLKQLCSLEYISLTCYPTSELLETILELSTLRRCRLKLWQPICIITKDFSSYSNIEMLSIKLLDDPHHSILYALLLHMPKLKYLQINDSKQIPSFNQKTIVLESLQVFKFTWHCRRYKHDCWTNYPFIIPNLRYLHITLYYVQFDDIYEYNLTDYLRSLLITTKLLKIIIFFNQLLNRMTDNISNKLHTYSQYLSMELARQSGTVCSTEWKEENRNTHKIQINIM